MTDDGSYRAAAIAAHADALEAALAAFEEPMFARSAGEAARMQEHCFGAGAPQSMVAFFSGAA